MLVFSPGAQAIAQEIYADLVEDSCLGFCFEVHRAVKCGYFFLDDTDPDSMKDFGELQGGRGEWSNSAGEGLRGFFRNCPICRAWSFCELRQE